MNRELARLALGLAVYAGVLAFVSDDGRPEPIRVKTVKLLEIAP